MCVSCMQNKNLNQSDFTGGWRKKANGDERAMRKKIGGAGGKMREEDEGW